jgi:hypothetical protein
MKPALPLLGLLAAAAAVSLAPGAALGACPDPAEGTPATAPTATPATDPLPRPLPGDHPIFSSGDEDWMELRGAVEAGWRSVSGKEGRYAQDVNLDGGLRLLSADLEGTALQKGLLADSFSLSLQGLGDPDRLASFSIRADDAYDLRVHSDRQEYIFRATGDPHPFDTVREDDGARLSFHLLKNLEIHLSEDRQHRGGDAGLQEWFPNSQRNLSFPVAATIDYDGRFHSAGFDGSSGDFRFGATWSWSRAKDDSLRLLDRPGTQGQDLGLYRNLSSITSESASARAGVRLWKGKVDLEVLGTWNAGETDTLLREHDSYSVPDPDYLFLDNAGRTESNTRGGSGRVNLTVLPHPDWEVLARYETRFQDEIGSGVASPGDPFAAVPISTGTDTDLQRTGLEARWRASPAWRFRAGAEEVQETIVTRDNKLREWNPDTTAVTAGTEWNPSSRFDGSLLLREARTQHASTQLSADEGDWLSLRLRGKLDGGFHGTLFARVKRRTNDAADAFSTYDSYGYVFGHSDADGFAEASITREDFTYASDTRFVVDLAAKSGHRVRSDEAVTALTLDFSRKVKGPLRAFGSARWAEGSGGAPYVQSDASLGLGWRFAMSAELRLEARRVVYAERGRGMDDYAARLITLSVLYEF